MSSIFTTQTPTSLNEADVRSTLGVAFFSDSAGSITAIRYYKGSSQFDNSSISLGLYSSSGTLLGSGSRTQLSSDAVGWISVPLGTAVTITAATTYIAAYLSIAGGHYTVTPGGLSAAVDNAPLHAYADTSGQHNGLFHQTDSTLTFPTSTFGSSNYFVDVDFTASTVTVTGAVDAPLGGLDSQAAGKRSVPGSAAAPWGGLAVAVDGTVTSPPVHGVVQAPLAGLSTAAAGLRRVDSTVIAGLGGMSTQAAATRHVPGTVTAVLGGMATDITGDVTTPQVQGAVDAPLGGLNTTVAGEASGQVSGSISAPLGGLATAAAGRRSVHGQVAADLGGLDTVVDTVPARTRNITITISLITGGWSTAPAAGSWSTAAAGISGWGTDTPNGGWAADSITA